ncbi:hypothetical protein [Jidongwangia harbinensis]|uniref:hypothetical protein n=1 Tax=Jidongwangia harbinensis TaxID=2878561 RepID=UPI001CDA1EFE|nr:hypothetical protein [Jidongwangia harbinensis]MCA2212583.1 hypothetical protein [Jidongwangia harbinensis]
MLSAELRGDEREWHRIRDAELSGDWWYEVMPVSFILAARRRFGEHDRRTVTHFVRRFLTAFPGAEAFTHRDAEAVIRGALGEDWLLTAVDGERAGPVMYAALFALIDDLRLTDEQADELLADAEREIAAAYRSVQTPPPGPADAPALTFGMHRRTRQQLLPDEGLLPSRLAALREPRGYHGDKARKHGRRGRSPQPSTLAGRRLRAVLLRDPEERARVDEVSDTDLLRLYQAAFATALPIYLHPDPDVREIAALAKLTRDVFYQELDLMKTEFLARAALGEVVPLEGISNKDRYLSWTLALTTIADWWNSDTTAVDTVITDAEKAVAEAGYNLATAN